MTINQTKRVPDEELDQMIWKLERDGMTPKQLSLMRELREVRRAVTPTDDERIMAIEGIAPPAPVVPGVIATDDISYSVGRFRTHRDCYRDGWNACRAAMLKHSAPFIVTSDHRMMEMPKDEDIDDVAAMLQGGNHTEQHLDMVNYPVIPDGLAAAAPSGIQMIPDGYVMVPKEPTAKMYDAGDQQMATKQVWDAMLAAAPQPQNSPQNIPEIIPGWIPVSERMPEVGDIVLTAMGGSVNVGEMERSGANHRYFTSVISGRELPATHWQPLLAAPKEVG